MDEQLLLLFIMIAGAAAIPFAARRFSIPAAACEIIFGIVIFNTLLDHKPEWFILLKEIGFIYLMFIAGMELDLRALFDHRRTLLWYIALPSISFVGMPLICMALGLSFYLGIVVSVVSAGIILPVLKETGALKTGTGRHIINMSHTSELLSVAVLTGIDVYHLHGLSSMAATEALKLIGLLCVAVLFLKVLYISAWWNPGWIARVMESDDPVEEGIRAVIAIAFAGALLAHYGNVEAVLGSFMAGVLFSYVFKSKGRFEEKINAVGFGFFTPFFFIGVGATLDVTGIASFHTIGRAVLLSGLVFAGHCLLLPAAHLLNMSVRDALSCSLLMSAPLTLMVVAGKLGVDMGFLTAETNGIIVLSALISAILFPFLFKILQKPSPDS